MCAPVWAAACACRARCQCQVSSSVALHAWIWGAHQMASLAGPSPLGSILLPRLPSTGARVHLPCPFFSVGDVRTGPHACTAQASPTRPSAPPFNNISTCFCLFVVIWPLLQIKRGPLYTLVKRSTTELRSQLLDMLVLLLTSCKPRGLTTLFS